ncbi:hypothetical protein IAT38_001464 [Cryptococcus sp. DSM 104549]
MAPISRLEAPLRLAARPRTLPVQTRRHIAPIPSSRLTPSLSAGPSAVRSPISCQKRSFFSLPDISKLANLVPGAGQGGAPAEGVEVDGEVQRFHARKILPYSQAQLYALVSDVPSYASFIPFCQSSTVLSPSASSGSPSTREWVDWQPGTEPFEVLAELAVGFGGLEERYVSRVVGTPFESVVATASNQTPMFKTLTTSWSFTPASTLSPHPTASSSSSPSSPASASSPTTRLPNSTAPADPNVGPTLLTIDLAFSFINPLHRIASQAVLPKVADKMVEAFEGRCLKVWGKGEQ